MKRIELPYGRGIVDLDLEEAQVLASLKPREETVLGTSAITKALANPVAQEPLEELLVKTMKVSILCSDITRPAPTRQLILPLLRLLDKAGIPDSQITLVFALGTHRYQSDQEKTALLGSEILRRYRTINSPEDGFIRLGNTHRGTQVELARSVVEADLCLATGNVELHYYAGYTGGAKAIFPGAASPISICQNHALLLEPGATAGICSGNPVREDLEEAVDYLSRVSILNVVQNERQEIVGAVSGDFREAHRQACHIADRLYKLPICQQADIVLASAGGFPKDLNMYQAHKALENARQAVKPGGIIVFLAECPEGIGHPVFTRWLQEAESPAAILERFRRGFVFGGHLAARIARIVQTVQVYFISSMAPADVRTLFFQPFQNPVEALREAIKQQGGYAKILCMPYAGSTLPYPSLG